MGTRRSATRFSVLLLLAVGAVVLLVFVAGTFVQQCEALEISHSTLEKHGELGEVEGRESKLQGREEDSFEMEIEEEDDDDDYDEDQEEDEEYDEEEEDGDEEEDEDESDFDGEDFEDDVEGDDEFGVGEGEEAKFDEADVFVLGSGNFSEFVKSNRHVMVEFYTPWCGHCQMLAPEYAAAATILKGEAALAKVDATAYDELAREYSVDSYPSMFFFTDGMQKTYSGHRKKDEIVDFVKKKIGRSVSSVLSKEDAEVILGSQKSTMAIALLSSLEGSEAEEYSYAGRQEDEVLFYQTDDMGVAEVFSIHKDIKRPALVLLKQEPEKVSWFDGPFKRDAIAAFVAKNKLPLVITFSKANSGLIFESPIKKQEKASGTRDYLIILFANSVDYEKLYPAFKEASKALMGKLVFVHVDLEDSEQTPGIVEFFGLTGDEPKIMGYETQENGRKFMLKGNITAQNVKAKIFTKPVIYLKAVAYDLLEGSHYVMMINSKKAFGEDFVSDVLQPHLKSAPIPETNDEDVKTVVGLNLNDIVLDETKDAFLEIYAPWCGHCQALESVWNKLAKRLKAVDSIVIAKMDGTTNEHERAKSDGYPTLLFFPAGKKSFDPITFDGDRTVKDFIKFLKKEAAIPFVVPRKFHSDAGEMAAEPSIEFTSMTNSGETIIRSESSTKSREPGLESIIDDVLHSRNDEL